SVRSVRDVRVAQKHERKAESRQRSVTEAAYQRGREDEAAERERAMANAGAGAGAGMAGAPGTEPQHHRGLHFGHSHADRVPEQTQQAQPGYPQATPDGGYPPAPPQQGYPQPEQPPRT
ncbi:MAG: hypothetical protein ACTHMS_16925, partial [Jatrophihabitans sp.]